MEQYKLRGKVKTYKEIRDDILICEKLFNKNGTLIEEKHFFDDGSWSIAKSNYINNECHTNKIVYDNENAIKRSSKIITDRLYRVLYEKIQNTNGEITFKFECKKNDLGLIIKTVTSDLPYYYKYEYDSLNRLIKKIKYNKNDIIIETRTREFTQRNLTAQKKYNKDGILTDLRLYKYEQKKLVEKLCFKRNDKYIYNASPLSTNKQKEALERFHNNLKGINELKIDIKGNVLDFPLQIHFLDSLTTYEYDENSNLISKVEMDYRPDFNEEFLTARWHIIYEYNKNKQLKKKCTTHIKTDWDDYWEEEYNEDRQIDVKILDKRGNIIYLKESTPNQETYYEYEYFDGYKSQHLKMLKNNGNENNIPKDSINNESRSWWKRLWS